MNSRIRCLKNCVLFGELSNDNTIPTDRFTSKDYESDLSSMRLSSSSYPVETAYFDSETIDCSTSSPSLEVASSRLQQTSLHGIHHWRKVDERIGRGVAAKGNI